MTGFAKTDLIVGVRNCSYRPFLSPKSLFVGFLFSSKIKFIALLLYIRVSTIAGKLSKGK